MDAPDRPSRGADARFVRVVNADAYAVAGVRNEFAQWIRSHLALDEERVSDIVLAVNEALANSAEFAYVTLPEPGTVSIEAVHSPITASLVVVVSDNAEIPMRVDERFHERDRVLHRHLRTLLGRFVEFATTV